MLLFTIKLHPICTLQLKKQNLHPDWIMRNQGCLDICGVGNGRNTKRILECYKPKNHRKVVLGQLLRGALSRIPKSLRCNYEPFYIDMSNFFGKQEVI